ncbi:hypothetical protein CHLNCDRAFT_137305 [Chlorella variabilis]|uniref:Plastocyanin-like domain-containing protein n=1 Tax=Chlorella variabilis TaxID=554065 RepID=E1ZM53_CHLVA|nr:hypothetical protein CHLNCDRAFT_137305 [Chlorella variabilis]EFN52943.1 hypothetical protein CHLNCDRAFT_137305 [Chlorella variabilis]|eukprot:XP_005845045.1 hypothetical protein CHLNCDRAFT_137305 [Chlorella variabilis]
MLLIHPDPEPLVLPIGSVVHWDFTGMIGHPFHMHVVPFQIQALPLDALQPGMRYSNYFEVGDWHDTLNLPQTRSNASIPLRMNPYEISGYSVMHCHFLQHEDMGCMKMVKFECPGSDDPQPITCKAEPAVQGTMPMDDRKKMRRSGRRLSMQ